MSEWQPPQPPPPGPYQPWPAPHPTSHAKPTRGGSGWIAAIVVALLVGIGAGFGIGYATGSTSRGTGLPASTSKASSAAGASAANRITVNGTMTITGADNYVDDGSGGCTGASGYDDIGPGAEVVISDDTGHTLAITTLQSGDATSGSCVLPFHTTVPAGKRFYGITVTHRGTVKFSEAQMSSPAVTIGD